ncbi:Tetratricopeptide repeat protein [Phycisphaerae bacterium RAS1]|nr:Tetratricopeptide repeat protein [Phycisphaerae bacterium RAS1]
MRQELDSPGGAARPLPVLAWLSVFALTLLYLSLSIERIWSADIWWQLRTGQIVQQYNGTPTKDMLSYTAVGRDWIELRWLFCWTLYRMWINGGPAAVTIAMSVVIGAAWAVIAWPVRRTVGAPMGMLLLAAGVFAAYSRYVARPEIVTFLMLAIWLVTLESNRGQRRNWILWLLPVLQIGWTNSHTVFILGPLLVWLFTGCDAVQRVVGSIGRRPTKRSGAAAFVDLRLVICALLVTAACWLNPYGRAGVLFPFLLLSELQKDHLLGRAISEFISPFQVEYASWAPDWWSAWLAAAAGLLLFIANWRRFDFARFATFVAFTYLASLAARNVSMFALVTAWASLRNLHERLETGAARRAVRPASALPNLGHAGFSLAALVLTFFSVNDYLRVEVFKSPRRFGLGLVESQAPRAAADFLLASGARPNVMHSMTDGDYLTWAAYGKYPVYVDGRLEVYDPRFMREYLLGMEQSYQQIADARSVNVLFMQRATAEPIIAHALASKQWVPVFVDPRNVILVRDIPEHEELIRKHRIDPRQPWTPRGPEPDERPTGWRAAIGAAETPWHTYEMALSLLSIGSADNAVPYLEKALERFPGHAPSRAMLAALHRLRGREREAEALLARGPLPGDVAAVADFKLAELLLAEERRDEAVRALERAAASDPSDASYPAGIGQIKLESREFAAAAAAFRAALALDAASPNSWIGLGEACEEIDDAGGALEAFRRAVVLDPALFQVHNKLGIMYAKRGMGSAAVECFETALRINPRYAEARANLEFLKSAMSPQSRPGGQ